MNGLEIAAMMLCWTIGTYLLAHYLGREAGYEEGYNRASRRRRCVECGMSEGYATIGTFKNPTRRSN